MFGRHNIRPPHFASKVSYSASSHSFAECSRSASCCYAAIAMKAVHQSDTRGVCITLKPAERPMSLPFANNQPGRLFHCLPHWKQIETPSRLRGCNQKNAAGLSQFDLCHEFANTPVADERGVSVFRIDHEALARTHGDECLRTLSEKDDVVFSVVWRVFLA